MTHVVHPKVFRIKELTDWDSRGFYQKNFPANLEEDFKIREFLGKKLGKIGVAKIEIERFPEKINIVISSARPGMIIGRGGGGVEELKRELEAILKFTKTAIHPPPSRKRAPEKRELKLEIREVKNPWASASLAGQFIAQQIEKRIHHRRVLKQALNKIMAVKGVEGVRIEVAGRLNGVEIARTEWLKRGKLPRQTLRADIDYAQARAYCTYGVIGIKVWIYKGEKFE
ncbi:MAG: 30S ribosomal protein S3 [Candidatus Nealsonbacteria bacterium CG18_big_fil_WC_8_21_14_2_50_37_10]|uniref:Small ribosomal subunit protein uS3 n=1 Tax=Candidatus Nealsonbacteria bacterium CG18_big_fil_WC_8_21_14_2_50_37_10 TaxID=1974717 RepID=A0A2H0FG94_9BACT|nr:MAG: 30S ribosomal protein S3 [Candidatus Nealsonbacteria bacterium CG18_big_fil_WC_8_21_14_2_50_37_10]